VAAAQLLVTVRGSAVSVGVEKAALAGDKGSADSDGLRALLTRPVLGTVPLGTSRLRLPGLERLALGLAVDWRARGVAVAVAPGNASAPATGRGGPEAPANGDLTVEIPFALVNRLLEGALAPGPIRLRVESEEIELSDLRIAGGGGGPVLTGRASPRSLPQPFDLVIELGGADLQVVEVRAWAPGEDCGALGILERLACNTRNAGRTAAAGALAATLRARYQGQLVRSLVGRQPLHLDLGGRSLVLDAELLTLGAAGATLRAEARAAAPTSVGP
jgi:hypothetical protein